ncbi:MAG TPA: PQQ-binding-like beta-propeller repeat protein, partial [Chthoniobacteraceae bacterium]|nr:PQQ-binding-like beta-propeller repeat protein [Chthoniobacteraceae bacterium]
DGDFVILASDKMKKVLSEINMGSPVYSTPIVANGTLFVGTQTHLFAIAEGAKATESSGAKSATGTARPTNASAPDATAAPAAPSKGESKTTTPAKSGTAAKAKPATGAKKSAK